MKKLLILFIIVIFAATFVVAAESYVFKAGISKIDNIPKEFFGTWSVKAERVYTDDAKYFAESTLDLWNLRRSGNVLELRNPVTGAVADIYLNDVNGKEITFTHNETEGNVKLKDTVVMIVEGNSFTGINELALEITKQDAYGKYKKEYKKARYKLKGSKFSQ